MTLAFKCEAVVMDGAMWTEVGSLLTPRSAHRSIVINNSIMHIGGQTSGEIWLNDLTYFERWTPNWIGTKFRKEKLETRLYGYQSYPEAFVVRNDFC